MKDSATVIKGDNKRHLIVKGGNTNDIIKTIQEADKWGEYWVKDFAPSMLGTTWLETYQNIYNYVRTSIPYKEDEGLQDVQLPGQLYNNRLKELGGTGKGGDCKSMSLFVASCLKALGNYDFSYRFISQKNNVNFHHVYIIAKYDEDSYVCIDCTLGTFGYELPHVKVIDKEPCRAYPADKISGSIGDAQTQIQMDTAYWQADTDYIKEHHIDLIAQVIGGEQAYLKRFYGASLNGDVIAGKKLLKKYVPELIKMSSILIYYYWNDASNVSYIACRTNLNQTSPIPFPSDMADKKELAQQMYDKFKSFKWRDGMIRGLCNLGVYFTYGIGLDYMLYRCYCKQLYGQQFKPRPGIPFYNLNTGALVGNGANLNSQIGIALCMPAQGGMGRPWKEPYWCVGGHIMTNGASDDEVNAWKLKPENARPGTITSNGVPIPGSITNNGAGVNIQAMQDALNIYNQWMAGNMVVLEQPNRKDDKMGFNAQVGEPRVGEVIAIVVAIIGAVAAAIAIIIKAVADSKKEAENADLVDSMSSKIPVPPRDFKFEYYTPDGCYIAACINEATCGSSKIKICNGVIVDDNVNTDLAQNQPRDPGSAFIDPNNIPSDLKKQRTAMIVGGVALALGGTYLLTSNNNNGN